MQGGTHPFWLTYEDPAQEARYTEFIYVSSGFFGGKLWHVLGLGINLTIFFYNHTMYHGWSWEMFTKPQWVGLTITSSVMILMGIGLFIERLHKYREILFLISLMTHWPAITIVSFFGVQQRWPYAFGMATGCLFFCTFVVQARFSRCLIFLGISPVLTLAITANTLPYNYWKNRSPMEIAYWIELFFPIVMLWFFEQSARKNFVAMERCGTDIVAVQQKIDNTRLLVANFFARTPTTDFLSVSSKQPVRMKIYPQTCMIVTDIAGFTAWASKTPPATVITVINAMFEDMDAKSDAFSVEKVSTIGDCFIGAVFPRDDTPLEKRCCDAICFSVAILPSAGDLILRIGVHCGTATAGFVGSSPPKFELFGEDVNLAKTLESGGIPGKVHLSHQTLSYVKGCGVGENPEKTEMGEAISDWLPTCCDVEAEEDADEPHDVGFSSKQIFKICKALLKMGEGSGDGAADKKKGKKKGGGANDNIRARRSSLQTRILTNMASNPSAGPNSTAALGRGQSIRGIKYSRENLVRSTSSGHQSGEQSGRRRSIVQEDNVELLARGRNEDGGEVLGKGNKFEMQLQISQPSGEFDEQHMTIAVDKPPPVAGDQADGGGAASMQPHPLPNVPEHAGQTDGEPQSDLNPLTMTRIMDRRHLPEVTLGQEMTVVEEDDGGGSADGGSCGTAPPSPQHLGDGLLPPTPALRAAVLHDHSGGGGGGAAAAGLDQEGGGGLDRGTSSVSVSSILSDYDGGDDVVEFHPLFLYFHDPFNEVLFKEYLKNTGLEDTSILLMLALEWYLVFAQILVGCFDTVQNRLLFGACVLILIAYVIVVKVNTRWPGFRYYAIGTYTAVAVLAFGQTSSCSGEAKYYTCVYVTFYGFAAIYQSQFFLSFTLLQRQLFNVGLSVFFQLLTVIRIEAFKDDTLPYEVIWGLAIIANSSLSYFTDFSLRSAFSADRELKLLLRKAKGRHQETAKRAMDIMLPPFVSDRLTGGSTSTQAVAKQESVPLQDEEEIVFELGAQAVRDEPEEAKEIDGDKLSIAEKLWTFEAICVMFVSFKAPFNGAENRDPKSISTINETFEKIEKILKAHQIHKIKSISCAVLCVNGIADQKSSDCVVDMAKAALEIIHTVFTDHDDWLYSVGIHYGPCFGAVLGMKSLMFDVFGDTVNTASRMQSTAPRNAIQLTVGTGNLIKEFFELEQLPPVKVKGKGMLDTCQVVGAKPWI